MSALLTVQDVEKSFGPRQVLAGVSFAVHGGDRIGIVGLNGSGKSTLLRLLVGPEGVDGGQAREATPDRGLVTRRRDLSLAYVPQEPRLDPAHTVREALRAHDEALARLEALGAEVATAEGACLEVALHAQAELHERLSASGWNPEHELRGLAAALKLPPLDALVGTLSGGERRRVALERALLAQPEVLALDEPTNHLDARTVEWLEARLLAHCGALLLIPHDRYFLDRVATRILELDRGRLYAYEGGYTRILERQAERLAQEAARERERTAFIAGSSTGSAAAPRRAGPSRRRASIASRRRWRPARRRRRPGSRCSACACAPRCGSARPSSNCAAWASPSAAGASSRT